MVKFSKFCSESLHCDTERRCCVQMSENLSDGKSVKSCVIYQTKNAQIRFFLKLSLLRGSWPKSARASPASPQHLAHNIPNFNQIGSLLAEI